MKVAFVGTGVMGSLLVEAFLRSGALHPHNLSLSNRSILKAKMLAAKFPGIQVCDRNVDAVTGSNMIFLCVKPHQFPSVIADIRSRLEPQQIVISITSPVPIKELEAQISSKVAKIIPSITHSVHSGASLCIYGQRIKPEDRLLLEQLMSSISKPITIQESATRIASDITSCGPAFIAFIIQEWARYAAETTDITVSEALVLAAEMLVGTGRLLTDGGLSPEQLQQRVTVPGGVTAVGLTVLKERIRDVFPSLIEATHRKYDKDVAKVTELFRGAQPAPDISSAVTLSGFLASCNKTTLLSQVEQAETTPSSNDEHSTIDTKLEKIEKGPASTIQDECPHGRNSRNPGDDPDPQAP